VFDNTTAVYKQHTYLLSVKKSLFAGICKKTFLEKTKFEFFVCNKNRLLRHKKEDKSMERKEKVDAVMGGVVGGEAGVALVTSAVAGSAAPVISSTLATVGGVVGGGMATGVALVAAAPIALAGLGVLVGVKIVSRKKSTR
jgi:hypothetical protein